MRGAWSVKHQKNLYLVEWAREYLLDEGVPEDAILLLDFIESGSYYDAVNTRNRVLADESIKSLLVVTSDFHTRRTLWVFQRVFAGMNVRIGVYPAAKDVVQHGTRIKTLTLEFLKLMYYRVRYGFITA